MPEMTGDLTDDAVRVCVHELTVGARRFGWNGSEWWGPGTSEGRCALGPGLVPVAPDAGGLEVAEVGGGERVAEVSDLVVLRATLVDSDKREPVARYSVLAGHDLVVGHEEVL